MDNDGVVLYEELAGAVEEFNSDKDAIFNCFDDCQEHQEDGECGLLAYGVTRSLFSQHCEQSDSDELAEMEAALLQQLERLVANADPEELGLEVDENGIIID